MNSPEYTDGLMVNVIRQVIERRRLPLTHEKTTQRHIAEAFDVEKIVYEREVRLSDDDIPDFMVGGVAVEVKIKGAKTAIYRQLVRYASHTRVTRVVLVTGLAMTLPATVNGKPASVVSLSKGWL